MHLNIWNEFRHEVYDHCLLRAKDALFNTVDALMTETQATSLPEVTQSDASLNASGRRSTKPLKMAGSISRPCGGCSCSICLPTTWGAGCGLGLIPQASPVQKRGPPEIAMRCQCIICQNAKSRSPGDGSFRRWSPCLIRRAVGPTSWICNGWTPRRPPCNWPSPNCSRSVPPCPKTRSSCWIEATTRFGCGASAVHRHFSCSTIEHLVRRERRRAICSINNHRK